MFLFLFLIFQLALVACSDQTMEQSGVIKVQPTSAEIAKWSYDESTGPEYWGELDPSNSACIKGNEQSPINLEFAQAKVDKKIKRNQIYYEPTTFTLLNNGHTIQANATTESNIIIVEGNAYTLAQFHFHTPSEHQFNGQHYDMELHLVHSDHNGKLAVIGVLIQEGGENKLLASVWGDLPKDNTKKESSEKHLIHLQALLPQNQMSFHYNGSLTTPPCTEQVKWIVLEQPIEMSKQQIQAFQEIFSDNHRPVQPLNNREIIKN
jgi:carbonic anhydrase